MEGPGCREDKMGEGIQSRSRKGKKGEGKGKEKGISWVRAMTRTA